ncbi:MAG: hypothetical protein QNJ74_12050 [Trichodesmium sp. MO_231.B1]|nr:hypothetical protein [Trichodesmium sp. MO_231.B1]
MIGGLPQARYRYETDYWGLSMREGMEWINQNWTTGIKVISSSQLVSSRTFARPGIEVIGLGNFNPKENSLPFYYIARPWSNFQDKFSECPIVYQVLKQNVPLTIVRKCNGD